MRQPGQLLMFSDVELDVLKGAFGDNEDLLFAVRKVLLQGELTKEEKTMIKAFITEPVFNVLKKRFIGGIDLDSPLGQIFYINFNVQDKLRTLDPDSMSPIFEALILESDYLEQQFLVLKDIEAKVIQPIKLSELLVLKHKNAEERFINTSAFTFLTSYVDTMLIHIRTLAGKKTESVEEIKKRLQRDSTK